ncbi:MAG: TraB/GumN family protein [Gammaproteobacteria bacterium]|nr:TraB/GumN family protein [Gammaproteobacteria bacterium]
MQTRENIFYRIVKDNKINYLLGTIPCRDADSIALSSVAKHAFEHADRVGFECSSDHDEITSVYDSLIKEWFNDHKKEIIPFEIEDEYRDKMIELFAYKAKCSKEKLSAIFDKMKSTTPPFSLLWQACLILRQKNLGLTDGPHLELLLLNQANKLKKPIIYLNSLESELSNIFGLEFNYQQQLEVFMDQIKAVLVSEAVMKAKANKLSQFYQEGDLQGINELLFHDIEKSHSEITKQILNSISNDRDLIYADKITEYFQSGNSFIAIGACHLTRVIELLKKQGFTVNNIKEGPRVYPIQHSDTAKIAAPLSILANNSLFHRFKKDAINVQSRLNQHLTAFNEQGKNTDVLSCEPQPNRYLTKS